MKMLPSQAYLYDHWTGDDAPRVTLDDAGKPIKWHITLNEYQRSNLLWLLCDLIGYGKGPGGGVKPFTYANTGDWNGEIPNMLRVDHREDTTHRPNTPVEEIRRRIQVEQSIHDARLALRATSPAFPQSLPSFIDEHGDLVRSPKVGK
jgi:hypothetical protein